MPHQSTAYAALTADKPLVPIKYYIRDCEDSDVQIEVLYCGICHSDIHTARSEWGQTIYPLVAGHEFTGLVSAVGKDVTKVKIGDRVGVGCRVGSCGNCKECKRCWENYCSNCVRTYNQYDHNKKPTRGGYGKFVVVPERFVFTIPDNLPMDKAAPLLCAGITMWSPITYNPALMKGGQRCGVIGLGGLGHMAVMFLAKLGNEVTVITRSNLKADLAKELGAKHILVSSDEAAMNRAARSFDYLFDTVSAQKPMGTYVQLLDVEGILIMVGLPPAKDQIMLPCTSLIVGRRSIQGSVIGGTRETQEMLEFCAKENIVPYIELVRCDQVNECYERVVNGKVQFRFVMDVKNTAPNKGEQEFAY